MTKFSKKDLMEIRNEKIIELYNIGDTMIGIAEEVNVTMETVEWVLKANGLLKRKTRKHKYAEMDQYVLKLYKEGKNINEIASDLSSEGSLIAGILKKHNLLRQYTYGGKVFGTQAELEIGRKKISMEVAKLYKEGRSKDYLKEKFKLSMRSINAIIQHHEKGGGGTSGFISDRL